LPASIAIGGGLATASINDVLRHRQEEELAQAVSALDPAVDAGGTLPDGEAGALLAEESSELDLVVGSREYGSLCAALLGSVSCGLVRSAEAPLVVVPRAADDE
jgi:nucleotide-binding universal stress UspA family protein